MNKTVFAAFGVLLAITGMAAPAAAEEIVLISTHSRDFIGADAAHSGTLRTVGQQGDALVVDQIALDGNKMAFRARDGQFLRAGVGAQTLLAAASAHIRGWETFEIKKVSASKFAIRSVQNGLYVTLGADGRLSATADSVGSRETFSSRPAPVARPLPRPLPDQQAGGRPGNLMDLAGRWALAQVRTFDGSLTPLPAALRGDSFVRIRDNGRMSASTGCNDISGRVRQERDMVQFGEVASTKKLCIGDAGLYEMLLVIAFDHGRVVEADGNRLRFFDVNGDPVMVLRRN